MAIKPKAGHVIRYNSIPHEKLHGAFHVFAKLDGSNVRVEWTAKEGFHKFGKRKHLLGLGDPLFGAVDKMKEHESELSAIMNGKGWAKATLFFEYYGDTSFAGSHDFDKPMKVSLIDVHVYRKGFMDVGMYLLTFQESPVASPYLGLYYTDEFDQLVANGEFLGMSFEGVVAKRGGSNRREEFKVKNIAWINKVKELHGHNWKRYE